MSSWSKRVLGAALFLAFAVQLGCEYTGTVKAVREKDFYCKTGSKCTRGYEEHEVCYFACKEDAEAAGYTCCPKHAKKLKPEKKEKKVKAKKEEISSCASCPMRDTCDKKPGPYTGPVTGIKSQKIYSMKGCPCLKDVKKEDMVEFKCKKEAAEAGYKPCAECACFKDEPAAKPAEAKPAPTPAPAPPPAAPKTEPAKPAPAPTKAPEAKPAAPPAPQPQPAAQPAAPAPPKKEEAKPAPAPAPPKKEEAKPAPAPAPEKKEAQPATPPAAPPPAKKEEKEKT
ncbi:MAG: hypothetical protein AB1696_10550 [Planctomycetota bacterium]